jgi:Transglutaminase-like superfamily
MDELPADTFRYILTYLTNDHVAISRLFISCRVHHTLIRNNDALFERMLEDRWIRGLGRENIDAPRIEFERRYRLDMFAIKLVKQMTMDLRQALGNHAVSMNNFFKVGQRWDHPNWKILLSLRSNIQDILKSMANAKIDYSKEVLEQNVQRFLACRVLIAINLQECVHEWNDISAIELYHENRDQVIERFALLAVKAQMTPPELLAESTPIANVVTHELDRIAQCCRESVDACNHTLDKICVLNRVLVEDLGFSGNEDDYYNYKNSLLNHALDTKKGIPITLAIVYMCVARRLSLKVDLIGLPGHLVLGFVDDIAGKQRFVDVFGGCRLLDLEDCQTIAGLYGVTWDSSFVQPLDPAQVFLRILNNLFQCFSQFMVGGPDFTSPLDFRYGLYCQQGLLLSFHRQPSLARSVLMHFQDYSPLTISTELVKLYGLLVDDLA